MRPELTVLQLLVTILTNFTNCVVSNPAFMLQYVINGQLIDQCTLGS